MRRNRTRARRRMHDKELTDISMTPLIDTALTLLIIFMIATPMIQNAIKVTLPKGQAKEDAGVQQEVVVFVDKNNQIYFNKQKISSHQLIEVLQRKIGQEGERTVFVKADQAVPYGMVIELVDKIKVVGGVKYVALATEKRQSANPTA